MKIVFLSLLLAACVADPPLNAPWWNPINGRMPNDAEKRECEYDAQKVYLAGLDSPLRANYMAQLTYRACMKSKGYQQ